MYDSPSDTVWLRDYARAMESTALYSGTEASDGRLHPCPPAPPVLQVAWVPSTSLHHTPVSFRCNRSCSSSQRMPMYPLPRPLPFVASHTHTPTLADISYDRAPHHITHHTPPTPAYAAARHTATHTPSLACPHACPGAQCVPWDGSSQQMPDARQTACHPLSPFPPVQTHHWNTLLEHLLCEGRDKTTPTTPGSLASLVTTASQVAILLARSWLTPCHLRHRAIPPSPPTLLARSWLTPCHFRH